MLIVAFLAGFLFKSVLNYLFSIGVYIKLMKDYEVRYLIMSTNLIAWKSHALQILDLTYEKVSEEDPEQKESFKIFRNRVEEKYDKACDLLILHLKSVLPYAVNYNNWKEAMSYLESTKKR